MDFSFVNNLFLGRQELDFFKDSVKSQGYVKAFQQTIKNYGVVKLETADSGFNYLRVIQGSAVDKLTVKLGFAIDANMNIIHVKTNLVDVLTVPGDSVVRYVIIKYAENLIESGTVSVNTSGALTGLSTEFTKKLRGLPDFPSKISFPNSVLNTGEYIIQSVITDTSAQLNIASGLMLAEAGMEYKVVGTFTPGIAVPNIDKFPFKSDGYEIRLDVSPTLIANEEFILAEVISDGITTTITDRRLDAILTNNPSQSESPTATNALVGVELVQAENALSARDTSRVKIGWGFKSTTGSWNYNSGTNQITITAGSGGSFADTAAHTAGDFDGWNVFFKETGQVLGVVSSVNSGLNIVLQLEPTSGVPLTSDISVVPKATQIEISATNATNPNGDKTYLFDVLTGDGYCSIFTPATLTPIVLQYRHINGDKSTEFININDGTYLNSASFNDVGTQTGATTDSVTAATITLAAHADNFFAKKAWLDRVNIFAAMQQFNLGAQITYAALDDNISMDNSGNFHELIIDNQDAYWMSAKPDGTFAFIKLTAGLSSTIRFRSSGGVLIQPFSSRFTVVTDPGQTYAEFASGDVLLVVHYGGRWKIIASQSAATASKHIANVNARVDSIEAAWTDVPAILTNVYQNDASSGVGVDVPLNGALGTQAPQLGSYLRYKVIGKTCHVSFRLINIITTTNAAANAASIVMRDVLPISRDNVYGSAYINCPSHTAALAGQQTLKMIAGGNDLIVSANALGTSNTSFNREYDFSAISAITVVATAATGFNARYEISGTFTYELQ